MGIDFSKLQADFKEFLLDRGDITQEEYDSGAENISIFTHMSEFKDYLKAEYDCSDVSIFSMDINDILKMDFEDGRIINPDSRVSTQPDDNGETTGAQPDTEIPDGAEQSIEINDETANNIALENIDLITGILNELLQDDEIKSAIDNDSDGTISDEELSTFLESIKNYDNDNSSISIDDIISAVQEIKDGTFNKTEEDDEEIEEPEDVSTDSAAGTSSSSGSGGVGGAGGGGGVSGAGYSNNGVTQPEEKTLENMNKDELNAELSTAQTDLSEKQETLDNILNDTDPTIAGLKDAMDDAYKNFKDELEKLDEDMAKDLDDLKKQIDDKQKDIDAKDKEISDQECVLADAETAYDNAVSSRDNWQNIVDELENTDTSEMSSERKSKIESKKSEAQNNLDKAKQAVQDAETERNNAQQKLDSLKQEKEDLTNGDDNNSIDALNQKMEDLENDILDKYPELAEKDPDTGEFGPMKVYQDAKEEYTTTKAKMVESAQKAVSESQSYVDEVQTAINNYDNKQNERDYAVNDLQAAVEWARKYDDYSYAQMQQIFAELGYPYHSNAWCADFVRMALGEAIGDENLPEWYQNCSNKAFCPTIQQYGEGHQISAEEAQTGDIVLYDWDGDGVADHVGLFVDNGDGSTTITAIEGNTSGAGGGSCVEEKARERSSVLGIYSMHDV